MIPDSGRACLPYHNMGKFKAFWGKMRYIFAHALRGQGSRARCRPGAGTGGGGGEARQRDCCGKIRQDMRRKAFPAGARAACAVPPAGCWRCVFPACGRHERSAGRRTARQGGVPGALRNLERGGIQGAGSAKGPPGRRFGRKTRRNIPRREQHARRNNKARIFLKRRGLFCPLGGGVGLEAPCGWNGGTKNPGCGHNHGRP